MMVQEYLKGRLERFGRCLRQNSDVQADGQVVAISDGLKKARRRSNGLVPGCF